MKTLFASLAMSLMLLAAPQVTLADKSPEYKVVIQVSDNDPGKWNLALNNARNIQHDLGKDNAKIEIVAYGPGLNMLKFDSEVAGRLTEAAKNGVTLAACQNTMRAMKLTRQDISSSATLVPAGVVEIMKKEKAGYQYIRP
jgi:intracellular sulfur oxidation DsrE/DsrF family protein